ncbi:hypothetical protein TBLA_0E02980 [Henningerozyma blattae CBS 6284]|uniref:U3 small nucleolar RNA-associated protein 6 N-terminal domain-containing protein n=1 Tax=Henningerozyma blattae (strain ATCC 34711 / CBS 6284 / DSM 70876 / NBRC 10599 / NRRL Y-10934 / UCD 77-7) TaxID=1071380 RepID=I2H4Q0_HENB6|nr:hypothetical protein TBLA_0E02980 [Tetrapisispora blattae CBS 6284]CCH61352.1 hypothetical protein TBLA_0E02980 [Tetrapisispora blattae CBS 6284]
MSKTRYYLEQCIPELDDLVEKKIFTKDEVSKIMKKRTNFEHRLSSRGSSTQDYIRYIEYEILVDKLRYKRVKRIFQAKKTNSVSDWSIIRRIQQIYNRGCNKFPSDLRLWSNYLNFMKSSNYSKHFSYKQIHSIYNSLLKLHPNVVEIWISCAKYEYEVHANFKSCRIIFQNSLRFNPEDPKLWYEYINFELNFITKLINRRKVMKLINEREQELDMLNDQSKESKQNDDTVKITSGNDMKDKLNELPEADISMLGNADTNPALRGEIALSIFDISMKTLGNNYLNKHRGFYTMESGGQFDKELRVDTVVYLFKESMKYVELFCKFKDLDRIYLINHIIQYWKGEIFDLTLKEVSLEKYIMIIFMDIINNIRFMEIEELNIEQLQLSVKKYMSYRTKNEGEREELKKMYSEYLNDNYLAKISPDDKRYGILDLIIEKL